MTVDRGPIDVAVDTVTDTVYIADVTSAAVSVLDGAACNAHRSSGCHRPVPEQAVGSGPDVVAVNPATDTVYVGQGPGVGTMSIFKGRP